jgi:hypothetical protein
MADALRWAVCSILGIPSALLILLNWLIVIEAAVEVGRRSKSLSFSFCPPFLCGGAGAAACLACPWPGVWCWAWLPPLFDPSIALLVLCSALHVVARVGGLRPFNGRPTDQEHAEPDGATADGGRETGS